MLGALIASRKALQENMIVAHSRKLIVISSGDLVLRNLRGLFLMSGGHVTQCQNVSSGKHTPYLVRHASHGTTKS